MNDYNFINSKDKNEIINSISLFPKNNEIPFYVIDIINDNINNNDVILIGKMFSQNFYLEKDINNNLILNLLSSSKKNENENKNTKNKILLSNFCMNKVFLRVKKILKKLYFIINCDTKKLKKKSNPLLLLLSSSSSSTYKNNNEDEELNLFIDFLITYFNNFIKKYIGNISSSSSSSGVEKNEKQEEEEENPKKTIINNDTTLSSSILKYIINDNFKINDNNNKIIILEYSIFLNDNYKYDDNLFNNEINNIKNYFLELFFNKDNEINNILNINLIGLKRSPIEDLIIYTKWSGPNWIFINDYNNIFINNYCNKYFNNYDEKKILNIDDNILNVNLSDINIINKWYLSLNNINSNYKPIFKTISINIGYINDNKIFFISCFLSFYDDNNNNNNDNDFLNFFIKNKQNKNIIFIQNKNDNINILNNILNNNFDNININKSEKDLLNNFFNFLIYENPDIIIGWKPKKEELFYLKKRSKLKNISNNYIDFLFNKINIIDLSKLSEKLLCGCDKRLKSSFYPNFDFFENDILEKNNSDDNILLKNNYCYYENSITSNWINNPIKYINSIKNWIIYMKDKSIRYTNIMFYIDILKLCIELSNLSGSPFNIILDCKIVERSDYLILHSLYEYNYILPEKEMNDNNTILITKDIDEDNEIFLNKNSKKRYNDNSLLHNNNNNKKVSSILYDSKKINNTNKIHKFINDNDETNKEKHININNNNNNNDEINKYKHINENDDDINNNNEIDKDKYINKNNKDKHINVNLDNNNNDEINKDKHINININNNNNDEINKDININNNNNYEINNDEQHIYDDDNNNNTIENEDFGVGGLVIKPDIGIKYDGLIILFDFSSLYPSIISEYNLCLTTKITTTNNNNEIYQKSLLSIIMDNLIEKRNIIKLNNNNNNNSKQLSLKLMANSIYGCLGSKLSRFYNIFLASKITKYGRDILLKTINLIKNKLNINVIYGDTDSIMIYINKNDMLYFAADLLQHEEWKNCGDELINLSSSSCLNNNLNYKQIYSEILSKYICNFINLNYKKIKLRLDKIISSVYITKKKWYSYLLYSNNINDNIINDNRLSTINIIKNISLSNIFFFNKNNDDNNKKFEINKNYNYLLDIYNLSKNDSLLFTIKGFDNVKKSTCNESKIISISILYSYLVFIEYKQINKNYDFLLYKKFLNIILFSIEEKYKNNILLLNNNTINNYIIYQKLGKNLNYYNNNLNLHIQSCNDSSNNIIYKPYFKDDIVSYIICKQPRFKNLKNKSYLINEFMLFNYKYLNNNDDNINFIINNENNKPFYHQGDPNILLIDQIWYFENQIRPHVDRITSIFNL